MKNFLKNNWNIILIFVIAFICIIFLITNSQKILVKNPQKVMVEQAKFEIRIVNSIKPFNSIETGITSKNIKSVDIISSTEIQITLDEENRRILQKITSENIGKQIGIFIDDTIISAPTITEEISSGQLTISDNFTDTKLENLKTRLLGYYYK